MSRTGQEQRIQLPSRAYTKNANLKWIYNTLYGTNMMLPSVVQIDLEPNKNGISKSIDIVRFDFVAQLLSLLQDRVLMRSENLVINQGALCAETGITSVENRLKVIVRLRKVKLLGSRNKTSTLVHDCLNNSSVVCVRPLV